MVQIPGPGLKVGAKPRGSRGMLAHELTDALQLSGIKELAGSWGTISLGIKKFNI